MTTKSFFSRTLLILIIASFACDSEKIPGPEAAKEIMSTRTLGLAFLEEGQLAEAESTFVRLTDLAPDEALGFANLGLVQMRLGRYAEAEQNIKQALKLDPDSPDVRLMLADIYDLTDRNDAALRELEAALQKTPDHANSIYSLSQIHLNNGGDEDLRRAESLLAKLLTLKPGNVSIRLQLIDLALRLQKPDSAAAHLEALQQQIPDLPKESQTYFDEALAAARKGDADAALRPAMIVQNFLKVTPIYQAAIRELRGLSAAQTGTPLLTFSQDISIRPKDQRNIVETMKFTDAGGPAEIPQIQHDALSGFESGTAIAVADFDGDRQQDLYLSSAREIGGAYRRYLLKNDFGQFIDVTQSAGIDHPGRDLSAIFADFDNDGFLDLFITNEQGNVLYRNVEPGKFENVSASTGVGNSAGSSAAVFADLDHDGDLDIYLLNSGKNQLLRNNLDGAFTEQAEKMLLDGGDVVSRDAVFGDFDEDGDLDLIVQNEGAPPAFFSNLRQGQFKNMASESGLASIENASAIAQGDFNSDGFLDLFFGLANGGYALLANRGDGVFAPDQRSKALDDALRNVSALGAEFFDFDNDGFLDLLIVGRPISASGSGVKIFHNDGIGIFADTSPLLPGEITSARNFATMDYNEDGDIDFVAGGLDGQARLIRNDGGSANKYLKLKLVGLKAGSGKNNYYGIGSKLEVRAGDLYQMRVITRPMTHLGLEQRLKADVVRVLWPNGAPQNIFLPGSDQDLIEQQTLKGSCPFIYAWNGEAYEFHTDIMWRSALGMPLGIMGGGAAFASPKSTDGFSLLPGKKLKPKNGKYSLQITEELWEAAYLDKFRLIAVDHPDSIAIFLDERFTPPPFPEHRIYKTGKRFLPKAAFDDRGNDVLEKIIKKDDHYIANLKSARYQGYTELHDLTLDLGEVARPENVRLFLNGWIFPADASINVAVRQSNAIDAVSPYVQVPNANGDWQTVIPALGFPMGKNKTIVLDLAGKFLTDDYRVRIRTNMQIYWDSIFYTCDEPEAGLVETELAPISADLHYRGFSREYRKGGRYGPHWFDYSEVSSEPKWRDLIGNYTRFGDVLELLRESDDQYVIMNAGDEITVEFDARQLPDLPKGWQRDFMIYSDGWVKDGDLNTATGKMVAPLPFHALEDYPYSENDVLPPELLKVYNETWNTREVTTAALRDLLKPPMTAFLKRLFLSKISK